MRRGSGAAFLGLVMLAAMLQAAPLPAVAQLGQVGFRAHSFSGFGAEASGKAITGQKPESKLWFHDGKWWAAMLDPGEAGAHTIHRLDGETWVSTGVVIDSRPSIKEDVLSLGNKLYILARANGDAGDNKLTRFTYASGAYSLDTGFPVDAPDTNAETTTLARDSLGNLWVSYEQKGDIVVARTEGSDTQWGAPFEIPVPGATNVLGDDIAAVISFTDDAGPAIGVMWSDQKADNISFAVHRDGAADNSWTEETALSGNFEADDHINMKTADNQVFSVVKTSHDDDQPLIRMLVRSPSGVWGRHPVALVSEDNTRPITILHVDPNERKAYVFMTIDSGRNSKGIAYKATSIDNISFPAQATVFIRGASAEPINNATSMKANATAASGIVVLASDGSHYWWNRLGGSEPPPNSAPSASNTSDATPQNMAVTMTLTATDQETCELDFSVVTQPDHGNLSTLANEPCSPGDPNTDSAEVTYTPNAGFTGTDTFTFRASDGELDSNFATVTVTVTEPPNTAPIASDGSATTPQDTAKTVTLSATDQETCELTFTVVTQPADGSVSPPSEEACSPGDPNTDSAEVTYTPNAGFTGTDTFTFQTSDGELESNGATVTVTVTAPRTLKSDSRTNLKHRGKPHRFFGRVKSDHKRCVSRRKLVVKKVRPGRDRVVARTMSSGKGKWSARHHRGGKGHYYAAVKGPTILDGNNTIKCLAGRSATKRFRR